MKFSGALLGVVVVTNVAAFAPSSPLFVSRRGVVFPSCTSSSILMTVLKQETGRSQLGEWSSSSQSLRVRGRPRTTTTNLEL